MAKKEHVSETPATYVPSPSSLKCSIARPLALSLREVVE
jgi:hypothetical protein